MKKLVVLLLASLLVANVASAIVDADDNSMGIYFDLNADIVEFAGAPYTMVPTYVMLTNCTEGAIGGYEFGYTVTGAHMVSGTALAGPGFIDVGGAPGNHIVGLGGPLATGPATVLCTLTIFVMGPDPIGFTLTGATPNSFGSNLPGVLLPGDALLECGTSSYVDGVCGVSAYINGSGVVATDEASWDQVKSLYR